MAADAAPGDAALADGLAGWLAARRGLAHPVVDSLSRPSAGYSSETVFVDLTWTDRGAEHRDSLVVRMAPPAVGTFPHYDLVAQGQAQMAAAAVGVPVADPLVETDPRWLGAPFMVMPRVDGHIVGALAHRDPWLASLAPAERSRVYDHFLAHPGGHPPGRPFRGRGGAPAGQPRRAGLLGGVPRLVERGSPGAGAGRGAAVVPGPPADRRAGPGPPVGGRPVREHGAR